MKVVYHHDPGAVIGLPYQRFCKCDCHEGESSMHMFPCCEPDSSAVEYVGRLQDQLVQVLKLSNGMEKRIEELEKAYNQLLAEYRSFRSGHDAL